MKNILFLLALLAGMLAMPAPSAAQTPTDKQLAAIEKIMAPQRKKVTDVLEADKTGQYKTYKADLEALAKEKDLDRQQEMFVKLERNLGIQDLDNLPNCLAEYGLLKLLGQKSSVQDLLDLSNLYLQGAVGSFPADMPGLLNTALENLNSFRAHCEPNAPCEQSVKPSGERGGSENKTVLGARILPNPATNSVEIRFDSRETTSVRVDVFDIAGRWVLGYIVQAVPGENRLRVDVSGLSPGMFSVVIGSGEGKEVLKLTIMRN